MIGKRGDNCACWLLFSCFVFFKVVVLIGNCKTDLFGSAPLPTRVKPNFLFEKAWRKDRGGEPYFLLLTGICYLHWFLLRRSQGQIVLIFCYLGNMLEFMRTRFGKNCWVQGVVAVNSCGWKIVGLLRYGPEREDPLWEMRDDILRILRLPELLPVFGSFFSFPKRLVLEGLFKGSLSLFEAFLRAPYPLLRPF